MAAGRPSPRVTWWRDNIMLTDRYERRPPSRVQNVLRLEHLERRQLNQVYTCKAANNQLAAPVTSSVRLDMNREYLDLRATKNNNNKQKQREDTETQNA